MLKQTAFAVVAVVIVGKGLIVNVNKFPAFVQLLPLLTIIVPVYVPGATLAATGIVTGLTGNVVDPTSTKPAAMAAGFHVIVYLAGELVTAL